MTVKSFLFLLLEVVREEKKKKIFEISMTEKFTYFDTSNKF